MTHDHVTWFVGTQLISRTLYRPRATHNESCHIQMSHVTRTVWQRIMSHMHESCHTHCTDREQHSASHVTYEQVMSHTNESCHTLRVTRNHVTYA